MSESASRAAIAAVARAMGPEVDGVVFVGGTVPALYRLSPAVGVRATKDVDVIVDVLLHDWYAMVERLRARGFEACTDEGAPVCRYVCGGLLVDLMPTKQTPVGPTNRWYVEAFATAASYDVEPGLAVHAVTPIYFVATKLVAFASRGAKAYADSHDLEDLLAVLSDVDELRAEVAGGASAVAAWVRAELVALAALEEFRDALRGHFRGDREGERRAELVRRWLVDLAGAPS